MPEQSPSAPGAQRVLVVDDNQDAANSLAVLLKVLGHDVMTAFDGPSALELVPLFKPRLVLLDLAMPGMDGFAVAHALRTRAGGKELVIVALTGFGQSDFLRATREAGFDTHLVKPTSAAAVSKLIAAQLH